MFAHIPWLALSVAAYAGVVVSGASFEATVLETRLPSSGLWTATVGDVLLAATLLLLYFEILKAARVGGNSIVDHSLTMIVFALCVALFIAWPPAGTSLFLLIAIVVAIDLAAGVSISIRAARRDVAYTHRP